MHAFSGPSEMTQLELMREFGPWQTVAVDYVAHEGDEITLAKHTRCRTLYHANDIQDKNGYSGSWKHVETADGRRGFSPSCISTTHTSDFSGLFQRAGHGQYHGYVYSFQSFDSRWAACGMPGEGILQLRNNWGNGGNNVSPEVYYQRPYEQWKCSGCKLLKPNTGYSRYQWAVSQDSLCVDCERLRDPEGSCQCTRQLENWRLCASCIQRATPHSAKAHAHALTKATKITPGSSTRPYSACLKFDKGYGRIVGCD